MAGGTPGLMEPGNIDLENRPLATNPDGSISTVRSMSFNEDGKEVLVPTVSDDGRVLSDDAAIDQYRQTGRHLGIFDTPDNATAYAEKLHEEQAARYVGAGGAKGPTGKLTQARQEGNDWNDIDGYLAQKREQANKFGYSDADVDKFLGYQDPTRRFDDIQNKAADNVAAANVKPGVSAADLVGAASGGLIKLGAEKPLPDGPLPIELRNEYAQALMNGEVKDAGDFAEKYANTVGAAASFGGEFSGEQVGQFQGLTTELQKKLPDLKSLIDYSIGLNPADPTFTQQQMMQRWVQTGETPDQVYQRAQTDAQVRMELTTPRPPDQPTVTADIQAAATRPTPTMTLQNLWNVFKAAGEEFGTDTQGAYDYLNTHFLDARSQRGLGPQLLRSAYALVGGLFAGAPGAVLKAIEQTGIETGQPQLGRDLAGMLEAYMNEVGARGGHGITPQEMNPEALAAINRGAKTLIDTALDTRGSGPGLTPLIPDKDRPLPPVSNPGPGERASIFHEAIPPEFLDPKNKNQTAQIIHDDVLRLSGGANNNKTNFDFNAEKPLRKDRPEWFEPEFGQKVIDEIENRGVTGKPVSPDVAEWEQHPIINGARQSHWEALEDAKNIIYDMEKREDAPPYERRQMPSDYLPRTIYDAQRRDPHAPAWTQESAPTAFGSKYAPGVPSLKVPGERQFYVKEYDPKETGNRIREVQEHSKDTDKVEVNQRGTDDKGLYTVKDATIKEINDHTAAKAAEAEAAGERARPAPIYRMKPFENLRDALLDARYKRDFMQTLQRNQKLLQDRGLFIPVDDARAQLGNWQKDVPASFEDIRTGEKFEGGAVDLPLGFRGWVPKPFAEELERLTKNQGIFGNNELGDAWNKTNTLMLRSLFISPVPHTLNVLGHWAMGRGLIGTFAYPGLPSMVMNGARAYLEVKNIGPIYSAIEREGAGLQYGRTLGQALNKTYLEQMALEMQTNPTVWETAAKATGFATVKDLVAGLYNASNRNLWFMNDVMAVQRVMELMDYNKLGMREAIRQMQREIVTYDLPVRTLGSRGLSQLLADNKIVMFGRYDYGRVKLFGNMVQDMVGMGPHGAAGIPHAIDQALMFAAMTAGVYGVNKAIKDATGYDVSITLGPLFLPDMVKKLYDGKRLDAIPFHISPVIGNLALAAKNMNWQGKPLVGGQKDAPGQVSDAIRAAAGMIPPLQTGLNIASGRPASTELTRMFTGINVKTPDQVAAAEAFKKREAAMERNQEGKDWLAKLLGSDVQPPAPRISVPRGGSTAAPPSGFIGPAPRTRAGGNQAPSGYIKPSSPRTRNK